MIALIDYGAGILLRARPGDRVDKGAPLAELFIGEHAKVDEARALAASAFTLAAAAPPPAPLVLDVAA